MNLNFLDFEQPIAELEAKIEELKRVGSDTEVNIGDEIARLEGKSRELTTAIFSRLKAFQVAQLARHPQRPYTLDYLSRIVAGSGLSLSVGLVAVLLSLLIGIPLGAYAGYLGGAFDAAVSWLLQVVWSIPTLLLVLALTLAFGKGFEQVFLAIGLSMWVEVARVVRGQVIALRNVEWVEAGRVLGLSTPRIVFLHILPNLTGPIAVIASASFG